MFERDLFVVEPAKAISVDAMLAMRANVTRQLTDAGVDDPIVLLVENGTYVSHERVKCSGERKHSGTVSIGIEIDTKDAIRSIDDVAAYAKERLPWVS